jgi:serine/threonine-protein kinase
MYAPVQAGEVLAGKYRAERVLGSGAMGVVVLATHTQLQQAVALKFLLPHASGDREVASRFVREARLAVMLKSEHVAKVLDVGTLDGGSPYIVMEYLSGEDLGQHLKRHGATSVSEAAELIIQACDAIAEAHALGIVHRDLKPANLFLTQRADGSPLVKVLDFGISKATLLEEGGNELTKTNAMMGSPLYMSPEQMRAPRDVDARSDVWSLGAILYQLLTARVPFEAETLGELMSRVLTEGPPRLAEHRPDAPPAVADLVTWCMQRDVKQRAPNVAEVAAALAPFAPTRARPIAERVTALLGQGARLRPAPPLSTAAPTELERSTRGLAISPPAGTLAISQPALSGSRHVDKKRPILAIAIVGGVLILAGLGVGIRHVLGSSRAASTASSEQAPSALAETPSPTTAHPMAVAPVPAAPAPSASAVVAPMASAPSIPGAAPKTRSAPGLAGSRARVLADPAPRPAVVPSPAPPASPPSQKSVLDDRN